jgi:hypothetical protein
MKKSFIKLPQGHHTMVTLNTDPAPGSSVTEINLNIGYYKTLPGILKLVQLVSRHSLWCHNIQHNDSQYNDIQHNEIQQ